MSARLPPAQTSAEAAPRAVVWPQGGFQWTEAWRIKLPIVRGMRVSPLPDAQGLHKLDLSTGDAAARADLIRRIGLDLGRDWTAWDFDTWRAHLRNSSLARRDTELWLQLYVHALLQGRRFLEPITARGVALHGAAFMLAITLELGAALTRERGQLDTVDFGVMRQAIALADAAAYEAALAVAYRERERNDAARLTCAHLFAHLEPWATDCVARRIDDPGGLLTTCVLPVNSALELFNRHASVMLPLPYDALLLQLHLHDAQALPLLDSLLSKSPDEATTFGLLALIRNIRAPQTLQLLARHMKAMPAWTALRELALQYPAATLQTVIEQAQASGSRVAQGWSVQLALQNPRACTQALASVPEPQRQQFRAQLTALEQEEAPLAALPAVLREPPWLRRHTPRPLPSFEQAPHDSPERIEWDAAQREAWLHYAANLRLTSMPSEEPARQQWLLGLLGIQPHAHARILAGKAPTSGDLVPLEGRNSLLLLFLPAAATLGLWNNLPPAQWLSYDDDRAPRAILARHGLAALPGVLAYVAKRPCEALPLARDIDSPRLVPLVLEAVHMARAKRAVETWNRAMDWIKVHPRTTLQVALPLAFGSQRALRQPAREVVCWLAQGAHAALVHEVAASYAGPMPAAVAALLEADPTLAVPTRMPRLPQFFIAPALSRLACATGARCHSRPSSISA